MNIKKNNAWYDNTIVPREMIRGAKAEIPGWGNFRKYYSLSCVR